jgi:hypothetical protein
MSRWSSQVLQRLWQFAHAAVSIVLAVVIVITVSTGALVWRLSQGPINLAWLAPRLDAMLNANSQERLHIGSVALAWEGWRGGVDRPVDLQLRGITAADVHGTVFAKIPQARLTLSFGWLLLGQLVPRTIEFDQANINLLRTADGIFQLGVGDHPAGSATRAPSFHASLTTVLRDSVRLREHERADADVPRSRWSELRRIRIMRANVVLIDHKLDTEWRFPQADFSLRRLRDGGMAGTGDMTLMLADQPVRLQIAAVAGTKERPSIQVRFGSLDLARLSRWAPQLKPVDAVHGSAAGTFRLDFDSAFDWQECALQAELGPGTVQLAQGSIPILGAALDLDLSPAGAELHSLRINLAGPAGAAPAMTWRGKAERKGERVAGSLEGDLDKLDMAELPQFWPSGLANGARNWVTRNVTAGTAQAAHVELGFQSSTNGSDAVLTRATARVTAEDLTIHWLRPLPPVEHVKADLTVLSPDSLVIKTEGGRVAGPGPGAILVRGGSIKVTGMMEKDQFGAIDVSLASSLPDALSLLREPRLHLLDRHPLELRSPSGQVTARIGLNLWLDDRVTFASIPIHASAELHKVHLGDVLKGRDLSDGDLKLEVDSDGMQLDGTAAIAGIPADLGVQMDFRAGTANQIRTRYQLSGSLQADELAKFGIDPNDAVRGRIGIQAAVSERRDGSGDAEIHTDLQHAELALAALGWRKRDGQPATGTAHLLLDHDRIAGIDHLALDGQALSVDATVQFVGSDPAVVRVNRAVLGNTSGTGEIRLTTARGAPRRIKLTGSSLDLTDRLNQPGAAAGGDSSVQSPWLADLKFDRVVLGPSRVLSDVAAQIRDDGAIVRQARITGRLADAGQFTVSVIPDAGDVRRVLVDSSNAGSLLRALNVTSTVDGGHLLLAARYGSTAGADPLFGNAEITSFRLRDAPAATRVLQAMTLYGLAAALRGPGLEISRLVAPFHLTNGILQLDDARAFSPSLGFTAKGRIDLDRRTAEIDGTIVPAYFFNSLLGRIPVIGNLFSPEKGGGMFAATYKVRGQLENPAVSVNPLAALTPGFLRGLFGVFQGDNASSAGAAR